MLVDAIHKFNADNGSFAEEYSKYFDMDDAGNVMTTGGKLLNIHELTASKLGVHFEFMS